MNTDAQYDRAIENCRDIFLKKTKDYGTSWRVYRTISIVDQIYIKAKRIRTTRKRAILTAAFIIVFIVTGKKMC